MYNSDAVEGSRIDLYPFKEDATVGRIPQTILKRKPTFDMGPYV
jgi:hypothetical protein